MTEKHFISLESLRDSAWCLGPDGQLPGFECGGYVGADSELVNVGDDDDWRDDDIWNV